MSVSQPWIAVMADLLHLPFVTKSLGHWERDSSAVLAAPQACWSCDHNAHGSNHEQPLACSPSSLCQPWAHAWINWHGKIHKHHGEGLFEKLSLEQRAFRRMVLTIGLTDTAKVKPGAVLDLTEAKFGMTTKHPFV